MLVPCHTTPTIVAWRNELCNHAMSLEVGDGFACTLLGRDAPRVILRRFASCVALGRPVHALFLGAVVPECKQRRKVLVAHGLPRDVLSAEAAGVKCLQWEIFGGDGLDRVLQIIEILVHDPLAANLFRDLFLVALEGDQLLTRRNVDAVDVGIPDRRRGTAKVDLGSACIPGHLHDLICGGSTHDGVVHQKDVAAFELVLDGVELEAHGLFSGRLSRHDERSGDIPILDEPLTEGTAQTVRTLQRRCSRRVGNWNDDVDVVVWVNALDLFRQLLSHVEAGFVHRHAIHD
mmetsp:Transcript_12175/g.33510  ORF Transcript_12175/g.33510 Transcript_12175/m.33510 type:complete len:290 (-) Transcript_12175:33-902(-)